MNEATTPQSLTLNTSLQQRGEALSEVSSKIGCGTYRFEKTGRTQLESLLRNGLNPWDKFLDIGCGVFLRRILGHAFSQ